MALKEEFATKLPSGLENAILFNLDDLECSYGVSIKYYDKPGTTVADRRMDYQLHLTVRKERARGTWFMRIDKDTLFFNQHKADLIGENIAAMVMEAIYPIHLEVDNQWQIRGGVLNHTEIIQRWAKVSEKIKSKYEGEITAGFIQRLTESLQNKKHFNDKMNNEMFWSILFHPKNINYGEELQRALSFSFPALPYQSLSFEGIQRMEKEITPYGDISLNYKGAHQSEAAYLKLHAQFDMAVQSKLLKNAYVTCKFYLDSQAERSHKKIVFSMSMLEFTQRRSLFG